MTDILYLKFGQRGFAEYCTLSRHSLISFVPTQAQRPVTSSCRTNCESSSSATHIEQSPRASCDEWQVAFYPEPTVQHERIAMDQRGRKSEHLHQERPIHEVLNTDSTIFDEL